MDTIPQKEIARRDGRFPKNTTVSGTLPEIGGVGQVLAEIKRGELLRKDDRDSTKKVKLIESKAAVIVQKYLKGRYAYEKATESWYQWVDTHWQMLEHQGDIDIALREILDTGCGDVGFKDAYKKEIKIALIDLDGLSLPGTNPDVLPFKNGLLNLETGRLEIVTPVNGQTWCIPYDYNPDSICPQISAWMLHCVDDDVATYEYMLVWLAAMMHGINSFQQFLHLLGPGRTGKSAFIRLARALVGKSNAVSTNLKILEENRFESARLYNKKLAVISDASRYGKGIEKVKEIVGGDTLRFERKTQNPKSDFEFQGLFLIASNEPIQTNDLTGGFDRRHTTVMFKRVVTESQMQDWESRGGEEAILHSELSGLVNLLLKIPRADIPKLIRKAPERVIESNRDSVLANNHIAEWVSCRTKPNPESWTQIGDGREIREQGKETKFDYAGERLYPDYLQWCSRNGYKFPVSSTRFTPLLIQVCESLGIDVVKRKKSQGHGMYGLEILPDPDLDSDEPF
jgi:putative DNA primase/helicase